MTFIGLTPVQRVFWTQWLTGALVWTLMNGMSFAQTISTVAGGGLLDGAQAIDARLNLPLSVFVDGAAGVVTVQASAAGISSATVVVKVEISTEAARASDFNGDGTVNFPDFLEFAQNFGKQQGDPDFETKYDLDESGSVDFGDFLQFAQAFGQSVSSGKPAAGAVQE